MKTENRLFFKGNPWPNGHPIKNFVWSGRLDADRQALIMDFHLETDTYNLEDKTDDEGEPESDWTAKIAWNNFHSCTLSSTEWYFGGILAGTEAQPVDFSTLDGFVLEADPLPLPDDFDLEDLAFHVYLLGHDSVANHRIVFKKATGNSYDIHWTGKAALTYIGEEDFEYDFEAFITGATFVGIEQSDELDEAQNRVLLEKCVGNANSFAIEGGKFIQS